MKDLIKAFLLGIVLVAAVLAAGIVAALAVPILLFAAVVFVIWFLLQILKDPPDEQGDDKKPP